VPVISKSTDVAQEPNRQLFLLTQGGQQALSLRFCRLQTVLPFTRVLAPSVLPRWHFVVGQWYLRPRPFCSPPLALGGWAMILDCWFLPESPWKKAQLSRRAVSVSESEPQRPPGNPPSRDLGASQGAILGRRARPTSDGGALVLCGLLFPSTMK
jgi:hypothetical protein